MEFAALLVGCPDDRGVRNNHGRPGAEDGPDAFRRMWKKLTGRIDLQAHLLDTGNIHVHPEDVSVSHQHAIDHYLQHHREASFSIWVGGGHDYAYPHLAAVRQGLESGQTIGCINIDPHFDLRPFDEAILSGSPFRMAIEKGVISGNQLVEFGIQRHCNAGFLWDYAEEHDVRIYRFEDLRFGHSITAFEQALNNLREQVDAIVISLDMDAMQASYAPGVSAPAIEGFHPSELLEMMLIAARDPKVISLGIYELNPEFDVDDRTARLAATAAYHLLDERLRR